MLILNLALVRGQRRTKRTSEAGDKFVGAGLPGGGVDVLFRELPLLQPIRYVLVNADMSKQHGKRWGGVGVRGMGGGI